MSLDYGDKRLEHDRETDKSQRMDRICRDLILDLKSAIPKPHEDEHCVCLIRFHNCTPHRITPYWIDFKGLPIKYPVLVRGASINIDTHVSQLWFFKAEPQHQPTQVSNNNLVASSENAIGAAKKILAIPEEAINLSCNASRYNFQSNHKLYSEQSPVSLGQSSGSNGRDLSANQRLASLILNGPNVVLICSLCKYVLKRFSRSPTQVPCHHFTGRARLSASDVECSRSKTNFNALGTYIYSCSPETHKREHSHQRRNIYLVESFHNLKERCYLMLSKKINQPDIVDLKLPITIQRDYIQFVTTMSKLNEN